MVLVGGENDLKWYRTAMAFTTLISTAVLALHIDDPAFAIVDCRTKLDDAAWGQREHAASHIPGAMYADLDRDLSGLKTAANGRHPLPDPHALAQTFSRPIWRDTAKPNVPAADGLKRNCENGIRNSAVQP